MFRIHLSFVIWHQFEWKAANLPPVTCDFMSAKFKFLWVLEYRLFDPRVWWAHWMRQTFCGFNSVCCGSVNTFWYVPVLGPGWTFTASAMASALAAAATASSLAPSGVSGTCLRKPFLKGPPVALPLATALSECSLEFSFCLPKFFVALCVAMQSCVK